MYALTWARQTDVAAGLLQSCYDILQSDEFIHQLAQERQDVYFDLEKYNEIQNDVPNRRLGIFFCIIDSRIFSCKGTE